MITKRMEIKIFKSKKEEKCVYIVYRHKNHRKHDDWQVKPWHIQVETAS